MAGDKDVEENGGNENLNGDVEKSSPWHGHGHGHDASMWMVFTLAYESVGVVYGDIGTSPLYTFATIFSNGVSDMRDLVGALSLIIWTLTLSPLVKYIIFVLSCNDNGEGGTFALYSLLCRNMSLSKLQVKGTDDHDLSQYTLEGIPSNSSSGSRQTFSQRLKSKLETTPWLQQSILTVVLLATSMIIGDGVLTPAQSVLSAVSGVQIQFSGVSQTVVVIISCGILLALFLGQSFGTEKVAFTFAPIVVLWLITIGVLGIYQIVDSGAWFIFKAFSPSYAIEFLTRNGKSGWVMLGGVFLCITGTEAMFADLGHFSKSAIQLAFGGFVYPCLMLAYIGQAAWLTKHMDEVTSTFYKSIPSPLFWPVLAIATGAAIVASQAMISATFSIVNQSMSLGCFPRVKITHTSQTVKGQIYIPEINTLLAILTILVTALMGGQGTTTIANAYGVTVSMVMIITTVLVTVVLICVKESSPITWITFFVFFFSFEAVFVSANLYKFVHGGWVPLAFACGFMTVMSIWRYGEEKKQSCNRSKKLSVDWALSVLQSKKISKVPGMGLIYTELSSGIPVVFAHFLKRIPAIHDVLVFLCVKDVEVPSVRKEERFRIYRLGTREAHMFRCIARYGYKDVNRQDAKGLPDMLLQALVQYLRTEDPSIWSHNSSNSPSKRESMQNVLQAGQEPVPAVGQEPEAEDIASIREQEVQMVMAAKTTGVTSIIGRTYMRAGDGDIVNKLLIDYGYGFLKANSRESAIVLNIPHDELLEVGMTFLAT
eukprot:TRINITY_DN562_c0_g1_i6.p1 TRINITY_DN562_c0_g1~~TRINITY_DN562_c0_g1_i6.p1  ORF type:complete len:768 (-),score=202.02 TRINITY_DN562_c0_g1_i6:346-2649(-)